ncbi:MAG: redox-regulated ATPase YchF [Spirochaetes bacterium]|nr:redox-regulated ATPase YchF [Spirochaetota bacterium]
MSLSIGIVGLPNVGKSTLFNALTNANVDAQNYPFCTIEPNTGVVPVVDERVDVLADMCASKKKIYATVSFTDIAGLVKGASKGEGLGNKFLSHIRSVDAIAHVVRVFADDNVTHIGALDPVRDVDIIHTELILADLESIAGRKDKTAKAAKSGDKDAQKEMAALEKCETHLNNGGLLSTLALDDEEKKAVAPMFFITLKPFLFAANVGENDFKNLNGNPHYAALADYAKKLGADVVPFSAKIEAELKDLADAERKEYLKDFGIERSGIERLAIAGYKLLKLATYLTAGEKETRAWTIHTGDTAPKAAGVIHTDFERGFIAADVIEYTKLVAAGSFAKARDIGAIRLEGKDYIVQDGDVIVFKFNV